MLLTDANCEGGEREAGEDVLDEVGLAGAE